MGSEESTPKPQKKMMRRVCYECATPIVDPLIVACPECGCLDIDGRRSRPRRPKIISGPKLPHPWSKLDLQGGGTAILSGNRGSGKTSICMALKPTRVMSSEQQAGQVAQIWYRVNPEDMSPPIFSTCEHIDELEQDLLELDEGDLAIVDSISQLQAGAKSADILEAAIHRIRRVGARAIFIAQFTKEGTMLGPNMLAHLVDVDLTIPDDPTGLRRLSTTKNRFGDLFTTYFKLDGRGVLEQDFRYAYSVEGSAGNYHLHMFPMGGAKLDGILKAMSKAGCRGLMRTASAAIECSIYDNGFAEPEDAERRRSFAEDHGLTWISPEDAATMIVEAIKEKMNGED